MSPKKIVLLRHGQTDFNLRGIVQGSGVDSALNATGRTQADRFYDAYQGYGFEKVYTSILRRTHQTVQHFIDSQLHWEKLADLNEISWGKHEGQPITAEEDIYYQWMLKQWQMGDTSHKIAGGESPDEVAVRLRRGLDVILNSPYEKILICMHGRAIRVMLCIMLNLPIKSMDLFEHQNACVYELQYDGSIFQVLKSNDVSHLKVQDPTFKIVEPANLKS